MPNRTIVFPVARAANHGSRPTTAAAIVIVVVGGGRYRSRRREITIPDAHQTRDTVLRVAKRYHGPGVVGLVPVVLRRVLRRLLDIVRHRVQAEIVGGRPRLRST